MRPAEPLLSPAADAHALPITAGKGGAGSGSPPPPGADEVLATLSLLALMFATWSLLSAAFLCMAILMHARTSGVNFRIHSWGWGKSIIVGVIHNGLVILLGFMLSVVSAVLLGTFHHLMSARARWEASTGCTSAERLVMGVCRWHPWCRGWRQLDSRTRCRRRAPARRVFPVDSRTRGPLPVGQRVSPRPPRTDCRGRRQQRELRPAREAERLSPQRRARIRRLARARPGDRLVPTSGGGSMFGLHPLPTGCIAAAFFRASGWTRGPSSKATCRRCWPCYRPDWRRLSTKSSSLIAVPLTNVLAHGPHAARMAPLDRSRVACE